MSVVSCLGDRRVADELEAMGTRAYRQASSMNLAARSARYAISGVPTDTGRLAASTRGGPEHVVDVDDGGYQIASATPYAPFVFGGTRHVAARPPRIAVSTLANDAARLVGADLAR
jgi:hypothetical protein